MLSVRCRVKSLEPARSPRSTQLQHAPAGFSKSVAVSRALHDKLAACSSHTLRALPHRLFNSPATHAEDFLSSVILTWCTKPKYGSDGRTRDAVAVATDAEGARRNSHQGQGHYRHLRREYPGMLTIAPLMRSSSPLLGSLLSSCSHL